MKTNERYDMKARIKQVTAFTTSEGELFEEYYEAAEAEAINKLFEIFEGNETVDVAEMARALRTKAAEFRAIMRLF